MKSQAVQYQGKTYRYVLSLLDVFSQFHRLYPLQIKQSRGIKENKKKIFAVHGMPETPQLDNGKEFKELVNQFCRMRKMRMVQSRPYNLKGQGKVKRSHRVLRNKLSTII